MHFRQKLAFFVVGCVFVIVGQVVTGVVVPSATAHGGFQDAEFNDVPVRSLTVVDDYGNVRVDARGDVGLAIRDSGGSLRLILSTASDVPRLSMRDAEDNSRLVLSVAPPELGGAIVTI